MKLYNIEIKQKYNDKNIKTRQCVWADEDIKIFIDEILQNEDLSSYIEFLENILNNEIKPRYIEISKGNYHDFKKITIFTENQKENSEVISIINNLIIDRLKDEIYILSDTQIIL